MLFDPDYYILLKLPNMLAFTIHFHLVNTTGFGILSKRIMCIKYLGHLVLSINCLFNHPRNRNMFIFIVWQMQINLFPHWSWLQRMRWVCVYKWRIVGILAWWEYFQWNVTNQFDFPLSRSFGLSWCYFVGVK